MQLEFDATIDDYVDMHMRAYRTSAVVRSFGRRDSMIAAFTAAVAALVLVPGSQPRKIVVAVCAVILAVVLDLALRPTLRRRRLRRFYRETLKTPSVRYAVDLRPSGLWYSDGTAEVLIPWTEVRDVDDEGDGQPVVIRYRAGGVMIVRGNGFRDLEHRSAFVSKIRDLLRGAD